ncbi:von Willebrand factor A domain-containing protein 9 [Portunus trituberculatus]|uniref:von Willebrand factor A domain-containing protein 9 n=1 Tax=Portunus trituberculatus TaxID=210409 RepID=A0A5B7FQ73_PORTR|nr:von Willebrand factor A domain-containing protein 9 [Portunus trituberculatus]
MPFTRDFEGIKNALTLADECDRTNLEVGLVGAAQHILEEWGNGTPCQIVLVTDGNAGTGQHHLQKTLMASHSRGASQFPLPFPFPAKLNIICIANPDEPCLQTSRPIYQRLVELNGEGDIMIPEGKLTRKPYCRHHDFEAVRVSVDPTIHVLGFLNTGDVSSPPAFSRHLVLPLSAKGKGTVGISALAHIPLSGQKRIRCRHLHCRKQMWKGQLYVAGSARFTGLKKEDMEEGPAVEPSTADVEGPAVAGSAGVTDGMSYWLEERADEGMFGFSCFFIIDFLIDLDTFVYVMSHFATPGRFWVTFLQGFQIFFDTTKTFSKSFDVQAMHRFFHVALFFCLL